jgi:UDP-N-acetyl-2-amino-2-deoxyglucuronate dehydrogenase
MSNFGMTGVAGFVAPRHLQAIHDTGNNLVAALDPHDSVGILDKHFPNCRFFTEPERFDRHLEKLRRDMNGIDYLSICSPNYLHDAHCRLALRVGANAICEKPLVINPWNLNQLKDLEKEYKKKIYVVLQLRYDSKVYEMRDIIETIGEYYKVTVTYITPRGKWYLTSWKGDEKKSGGLIMNIGIHLFDLMILLFGKPESFVIDQINETVVSGRLWLEKAHVDFFLTTEGDAKRVIEFNGYEFKFGENFTNLHTKVYQDILKGGGFGIEDTKQSIELVHLMRGADKCKFTKVAI